MQIKAIIPQNDPDQAELLPGKAATNVQIYPDKIQFSKKRSFAQISISILNETDQLSDIQYVIKHTTTSKNFDYHKLVIGLNVYRLGIGFIDLVAAGSDQAL